MRNEEYIDISKAFSSSLVEKVGASTTFNSFVPINKIAELKELKSNRSLRLAIQKGKYIAREVKVFGGKSYEILYSSLEPEIQEAYIERDISKLEVGDVLIADGHTLNFQVINPFTGKPTRATLVGFLDWKSTALVGYEIMMSENTQCIASALRNSLL